MVSRSEEERENGLDSGTAEMNVDARLRSWAFIGCVGGA